jgi:hypothetical protein
MNDVDGVGLQDARKDHGARQRVSLSRSTQHIEAGAVRETNIEEHPRPARRVREQGVCFARCSDDDYLTVPTNDPFQGSRDVRVILDH